MLQVYSKTHSLFKTAIVTRTSFVTCSRPGGASESEREKRERGGVHQLCQRGHARGEDSRGRAGGGAQNGDVHRDQPQCAIQLGESVHSVTIMAPHLLIICYILVWLEYQTILCPFSQLRAHQHPIAWFQRC